MDPGLLPERTYQILQPPITSKIREKFRIDSKTLAAKQERSSLALRGKDLRMAERERGADLPELQMECCAATGSKTAAASDQPHEREARAALELIQQITVESPASMQKISE